MEPPFLVFRSSREGKEDARFNRYCGRSGRRIQNNEEAIKSAASRAIAGILVSYLYRIYTVVMLPML